MLREPGGDVVAHGVGCNEFQDWTFRVRWKRRQSSEMLFDPLLVVVEDLEGSTETGGRPLDVRVDALRRSGS